MKKIFAITKWEFLEKVKTKAFIISLITTPLIIAAAALAPTLLAGDEDNTTKTVAVIDTSGIYFNLILENVEKYKLDNGQPRYIVVNFAKKNIPFDSVISLADKEILSHSLNAGFIIYNAETDSVRLEYRSTEIGSFREANRFEKAFNEIRITRRLDKEKIDTSIIDFVKTEIEATSIKVEEGGKEKKADFFTVFFTSFIFILLLMTMTLYSGQMLVRSLIEEKSNRLIEVLISSCSPNQLLAGKILGLSSVGLLQVFVWVLFGLFLVGYAIVPPDAFSNIFLILVYFILGFILYTSVFIGIGAAVNTEQEAQQITGYVTILLILPVVLAFAVIENPNSPIAETLTYIPFTMPAVMMLKLNAAPVSLPEILITLSILIITIFAITYLAAKIFRIGILSYGKAPSLSELLKWIKEE